MRDLNDEWFPCYETRKRIGLFYEYLECSKPALFDMPYRDPPAY